MPSKIIMNKNRCQENADSGKEVAIVIPPLEPDAQEFLVRLVSFWVDEVYVRKNNSLSENLWIKPVINVFNVDDALGITKTLQHNLDDAGSNELNLIPLLGPGRSFFSVQVVAAGETTARLHSHSTLDEYYLVLEGKGTLRYDGREIGIQKGDFISKPIGPDNTSHILANKGERLRLLDMEVWDQRRFYTSKDLLLNADHSELIMRGSGWSAIIPRDSL